MGTNDRETGRLNVGFINLITAEGGSQGWWIRS